jgi:glutathione synthase/RimK-type ligase-like ATP-grasp enzyme
MPKPAIYLRGPASDSADILKYQLEELGHKVTRSKEKAHNVIACWGCSVRELPRGHAPALNGNVNLYNKLQALQLFQKAGVLTPTVFSIEDAIDHIGEIPLPWLARKVYHERGKDITVCETRADVKSILRNRNADFFSVYLKHEMELRAWVCNGEVIAVYEKIYRNPGLMNFKNLEMRSELRDDLLRDAQIKTVSTACVKAMKMEFGGVDILRTVDGMPYVLEVNSMPEISSKIRVSGIRLAKHISTWAQAQ